MLILLALLALVLLPAPWGVVVLAAAVALELAELALWRHLLRRYRVRTGVEAAIGAAVEVLEPCDPEGRIRYRGEIWRARSSAPLARGASGTIVGFEGLTALIEPREGQ